MQSWRALINRISLRLANLLASFLLICGFAYAAWTVVPVDAATGPERLYRAASGGEPPLGARQIPVFIMRSDHSVVRYGTASPGSDERLEVRIFQTLANERPEATEALFFPPGFAVLWAAAADASRGELKARLNAVQDMFAQTIEDVIRSEEFNQVYRPMLRAILTDAVAQAWKDPRTQAAVEELLANADTAIWLKLHDDVEAIIKSRIQLAVWEMVRANWFNALGTPFGYEIDYTPILNAVSATLADARVQQALSATGSEWLGTAEMRRLAELIAIGASDALLRDRRVPKVVNALANDPNLRAMVAPLYEALVSLVSAVPRHLGGLGGESSLNPLAAQVFKSFALGQRMPLILFVTPEESDAIQRLNPEAANLLQPIDVAGRT